MIVDFLTKQFYTQYRPSVKSQILFYSTITWGKRTLQVIVLFDTFVPDTVDLSTKKTGYWLQLFRSLFQLYRKTPVTQRSLVDSVRSGKTPPLNLPESSTILFQYLKPEYTVGRNAYQTHPALPAALPADKKL